MIGVLIFPVSMGYCDVAVRGSERYRRCALELDIAIFVLCGLTFAARQMGVLKSPAGKPAGLLGCCEKKGIGSVFLQRGVFLVQRFLALEVGLGASVACADLQCCRLALFPHTDTAR